MKKKKATINLDDYFYDPSPKDEYSEMDDEVFHDVMEGLGILTPLPPQPMASDARKMLGLLEQVESLGG